MKKINTFLALALCVLLSTGMAFAQPVNNGAGWYEKIHGQNAGELKYFPNGHPENQSEWKFISAPPQDNGGCQGSGCFGGSGIFGASANAGNAQGMILDETAGVFGANGGFGFGNSIGGGFIINGVGSVAANAAGGSIGVTNLVTGPGVLGSESYNLAVTGADLALGVNPGIGLGYGEGVICGLAGQGTINLVNITNVDGVTFGGAAQGSIGGFHGGVDVAAGPDLYFWKWKIYDSKDYANIGAGIEMEGGSYAISFQTVPVVVDGATTSGLGNNVGAYTNLTSFGIGPVSGGWIAAGGAVTKTVMEGASAGAFGAYVGSGQLGCNYNGSAVGQSYVQKTTVEGMNGAIYQSGANMVVTSKVSKNVPN